LKELFIKYKSVIRFIVTFLLVYIVLTFAYKMYLQYSSDSEYYPDYMTHLVGVQSAELLTVLDYDVKLLPHPDEPSLKLIINNKYLARVIEGCNSISVIILFISFIIAFAGKFKTTAIYILAGSVLIYITNLVRIAAITAGLYHYPKHEYILHDIIFPAIIYGMVCLLWVVWVNHFSLKKEGDA